MWKDKEIIKVSVSKLQTHPLASEIYNYKKGKKELDFLAETMKLAGQLEPIIINDKKQILSGNRRWLAATSLRWKQMDAIISTPKRGQSDEQHLRETIVFHNQQRKKSYQEIINEAEAILGILGKNQGQRTDLLGDGKPTNPWGKIGSDRFEIAAKVVGNISGTQLRRLFDIVEFEKESSDNRKLGIVKRIINKEIPISRGHNVMKDFQRLNRERARTHTISISKNTSKEDYTLYLGSSSEMNQVETGSVQLVMTSPPYYKLRTYGNATEKINEMGSEDTPDEFIETLTIHLKDVRRVLNEKGSFFLNIGETYQDGRNLLISTRLLLELCKKNKWSLVNEIIWKKTNPLPQGHERRLQPSYEKVFHLVKDAANYYYKPLRVWNDNQMELVRIGNRRNATGGHSSPGLTLSRPYEKFMDFIEEQKFKDVITGISAGARQTELRQIDRTVDHPAIFPEYLPVLPILTTTKPGDIVLDPFSGSGTTGKAAVLLGRKYIGYELNNEFLELSKRDLKQTTDTYSKKDYESLMEKIY